MIDLINAYRDARDAEQAAEIAECVGLHTWVGQATMRGPESPGTVAALAELARRREATTAAQAASAAAFEALLAEIPRLDAGLLPAKE